MVPSLGESVTEAVVASWFKKVGNAVKADEPLCELETDKVSVEVPAPAAGTLSEILAEEGATVEASAKLAVLTTGAAASGGAKPEADATGGEPDEPRADYGRSDEAQAPDGGGRGSGRQDTEDAPSAKALMEEKGLERGQVEGTGRDGRVMKADVLRALEAPREAPAAKEAPRAPVAAEDEGREERVKMTRLRQTIARRLKDAQNTAAMLTTYNEVDMSAVMALRSEYKDLFEKKHGVKLGFMSFFHQGLLPCADRGSRGQCRDRRHRGRLQALRPHGHRGRHAQRARGPGGARRRLDGLRRDREGDQ